MRIPNDAVIPSEKLTKYLLVPRSWDDKSQFLARAGFSLDEPEQLENAIRRLAERNEAYTDGENDYGTFYRVEGALRGPKGTLLTVTVWIQQASDDRYRFITLKPAR